MKLTIYFVIIIVFFACNEIEGRNNVNNNIDVPIYSDTISTSVSADSQYLSIEGNSHKYILGVSGIKLVDFAQTLLGIPYKYASSNPLEGFDCSGFITYVFKHFHINVPRSSVDFTNAGKEIDLQAARVGDLILFTGTVDSIRIVGHMGIVTENRDTLKFIHATSGKANAVTVSLLTDHYKKRFVKVIRVLSE